MNLSTTKMELVKQLLNTTDKNIINHIKAVLTVSNNNQFDDLPPSVKASVSKGLNDSLNGNTISHNQAMKPYKKWIKK